MAFGISRDPGALISGGVLILVGIIQLTSASNVIDIKMTLVVAGALFIMEALSW